MDKPIIELTRQLMRADVPPGSNVVARAHCDKDGRLTHVSLHASTAGGTAKDLLIFIDCERKAAVNSSGVF